MRAHLHAPILSACIAAALCAVAPAHARTPVPAADGPIPATRESYPFGAADHTLRPQELDALGYTEEEFFLTGTANVYEWPENSGATVRTPNAPYTNRVLVRRPKDKAKFSGNVVVELLNPTNLFDLNIGWALSNKQIVRDGDAWVGVTCKPVAVVTLQTFNPTRYASLSWKNPAPELCASAGRGDTTSANENGLVWDIYTQTAAWLRSAEPTNPLLYGATAAADTPVKRLYGWGYSQTGGFLYTYINAIHPLAAKEDGRPPFDGYIVGVSSGPSAINQCAGGGAARGARGARGGDAARGGAAGDAAAVAAAPADGAPVAAARGARGARGGNAARGAAAATSAATALPRRLIQNAGVPVIRIMSQSDYLNARRGNRPDSDEKGDQYRNYEMAGSGHATPDELYFSAAPEDIAKGGRAVPPVDCTEGPRSRFPSSLTYDAALKNLDIWAREGMPAPKAEPIVVENGAAVLDEFGNVKGGVRSPFLDVPTSTWIGNSTGPSFCRIAGHEVPFGKEQLQKLYPDHATYVAAVKKNVESLVAQRFIVKEDGDELIAEAEKALIP